MHGRPKIKPAINPVKRIRLWYAFLILIMTIFLIRLFYLQILRYDYYKKVALQTQMKEYEIKPERGVIEVHDGKSIVPIVLNETRYTLFADPKFISDPTKTAEAVKNIVGGDSSDYVKKMKAPSRYAVLAKKLAKEQKDKVDKL